MSSPAAAAPPPVVLVLLLLSISSILKISSTLYYNSSTNCVNQYIFKEYSSTSLVFKMIIDSILKYQLKIENIFFSLSIVPIYIYIV